MPGALEFVSNPEPDHQTVTVIDEGRTYTYSEESRPLFRVALIVQRPTCAVSPTR